MLSAEGEASGGKFLFARKPFAILAATTVITDPTCGQWSNISTLYQGTAVVLKFVLVYESTTALLPPTGFDWWEARERVKAGLVKNFLAVKRKTRTSCFCKVGAPTFDQRWHFRKCISGVAVFLIKRMMAHHCVTLSWVTCSFKLKVQVSVSWLAEEYSSIKFLSLALI